MNSSHIYRPLWMVFIFWMITLPVGAREAGAPYQSDALQFSFYGKTLHASSLKPVEVKSVSHFDVTKAWNEYKKGEVAPVLASLRSLSSEMGLNDWFVFQLVRHYADALLQDGTPRDRVTLEHFLLVNLGYDVRLARTERQLLLLVPFE